MKWVKPLRRGAVGRWQLRRPVVQLGGRGRRGRGMCGWCGGEGGRGRRRVRRGGWGGRGRGGPSPWATRTHHLCHCEWATQRGAKVWYSSVGRVSPVGGDGGHR